MKKFNDSLVTKAYIREATVTPRFVFSWKTIKIREKDDDDE
jgi:hypothetical protein